MAMSRSSVTAGIDHRLVDHLVDTVDSDSHHVGGRNGGDLYRQRHSTHHLRHSPPYSRAVDGLRHCHAVIDHLVAYGQDTVADISVNG